jgi:hypothetical protein
MAYKATIGDYDTVIGSKTFDELDSAEIQAEKWLHNLGREHAQVESVICLITVQKHDTVNDSWDIISEFEF